jgi:hypothetical protein
MGGWLIAGVIGGVAGVILGVIVGFAFGVAFVLIMTNREPGGSILTSRSSGESSVSRATASGPDNRLSAANSRATTSE